MSTPGAPPPPAPSARSVSFAPRAYTLGREQERDDARPGDFASSRVPKPKAKGGGAGAGARPPVVKRAVTCEPGEGAAASSAAAPAAKKQKTEIPVVGIAFAMFCLLGEDHFYSFARLIARGLLAMDDVFCVVAAGDRHRWTPDLETKWKNGFYAEAPHTVYRVSKDGKLWVPEHVFTGDPSSRERKNGLVAITAVEQARAILEHMLNKKWVPKCAVSEQDWNEINALKDKKEIAAKAKAVALATEHTRLESLYFMLVLFSDDINKQNLSNQEICRGGIESGETAEQAMRRERTEEFGITGSEYLWTTKCGHVEFQSKGKLKRTALFVSFTSHPFHGNHRGNLWLAHNADLDAKYGNWFCAHSWYKFCPFLDTLAMDKVKANRETRDVREVTLEEAMRILGKPSKNALRAIIAHLKKKFSNVENPEEAESAAEPEAAAAAEPAAAKEPVIEQDLPPPGSEALKAYKITNHVPTLQGLLEEVQQKNDAEGIKWYAGLLEANKA